MNFNGHFNGGLVAGLISVGGAISTQYVTLQADSFSRFLENPFVLQGEIQTLLTLFLVTLFMALFPDLDTASIPQRWFFRSMFLVLLFLFLKKEIELFVICAFASLLPVMHKHRGWTHWKMTPWLIVLFLAIIVEYFHIQESWLSEFSWQRVWSSLEQFWMYIVACIFGHYTHLFLDSKKVRGLPFIENSQNHH